MSQCNISKFVCALDCGVKSDMTLKEMETHLKFDCQSVSVKCNTCNGTLLRKEQGSHDCIDVLLARNCDQQNAILDLQDEIKNYK